MLRGTERRIGSPGRLRPGVPGPAGPAAFAADTAIARLTWPHAEARRCPVGEGPEPDGGRRADRPSVRTGGRPPPPSSREAAVSPPPRGPAAYFSSGILPGVQGAPSASAFTSRAERSFAIDRSVSRAVPIPAAAVSTSFSWVAVGAAVVDQWP